MIKRIENLILKRIEQWETCFNNWYYRAMCYTNIEIILDVQYTVLYCTDWCNTWCFLYHPFNYNLLLSETNTSVRFSYCSHSWEAFFMTGRCDRRDDFNCCGWLSRYEVALQIHWNIFPAGIRKTVDCHAPSIRNILLNRFPLQSMQRRPSHPDRSPLLEALMRMWTLTLNCVTSRYLL